MFDNDFNKSFERGERNFWRAWWATLILILGFWATVLGLVIYLVVHYV